MSLDVKIKLKVPYIKMITSVIILIALFSEFMHTMRINPDIVIAVDTTAATTYLVATTVYVLWAYFKGDFPGGNSKDIIRFVAIFFDTFMYFGNIATVTTVAMPMELRVLLILRTVTMTLLLQWTLDSMYWRSKIDMLFDGDDWHGEDGE